MNEEEWVEMSDSAKEAWLQARGGYDNWTKNTGIRRDFEGVHPSEREITIELIGRYIDKKKEEARKEEDARRSARAKELHVKLSNHNYFYQQAVKQGPLMPGWEKSSDLRTFCFYLTQAMCLGKVSEYEKTVKIAQELGIIGEDFMEHLPENHKYLTQFVNSPDMVKFLLSHVDANTSEGVEFGTKLMENAVKNGVKYMTVIEAAAGKKELLLSFAQNTKDLGVLAKCVAIGVDIKAFDFEQTFIKCLGTYTRDSDLKFVTIKALEAGYQLDIDKLAEGKEIKEDKLTFIKDVVQTYHNADKSLIKVLQEDNADEIRKRIGNGRLSEYDIKYMMDFVENSQRGNFFDYYMTVMKSVPEAEKETLPFKQAEEMYIAEEKRKEEERIAKEKRKEEERIAEEKRKEEVRIIKEKIQKDGSLHHLVMDIMPYSQNAVDYLIRDNGGVSKVFSVSLLNDVEPQQLAADIREMPQEIINNLAKDVADHFSVYKYDSKTADEKDKEKSTPKIKDFHKIKFLAACLVLYEVSTGADKNALKAELLKYRTDGSDEERRKKAHMFVKAKNALEGNLEEDRVVKGLSRISYTQSSSLNKALRENSYVYDIKGILKRERNAYEDKLDTLKIASGISAASVAGVAAFWGLGHYVMTSAPDYPEGYYPEDYYDPTEMMTPEENEDFKVSSKEEFEQEVKEQGPESRDGKTYHFHHHHHRGGRSY